MVSDEIRATIIDHVINHGLTMREARPNLSRFTVVGKIQTFRNDNSYVTIYCNIHALMYI